MEKRELNKKNKIRSQKRLSTNGVGATKKSSPLNSLSDNPVSVKKIRSLKRKSKGLRGERRRHLEERLGSLNRRAILIEHELQKLEDNRFYRVCIFGSARIKPDTRAYHDVAVLAEMLAGEGIDILTGGGPGLMEAANKGALLGRQAKHSRSLSYGVTIQLEFEPEPNKHLDVKHHHQKFSSRLDQFMRLSHAVICTPGGIGTLLELYFCWQLIQVKHIPVRPIVLMDRDYWTGIIEWMKSTLIPRGLVGEKDFDVIRIVDTPEDAYEVISEHHRLFREGVKAAAALQNT